MKVALDGFALALKSGTGLSTYSRELASTLDKFGHSVALLYGADGVGRRKELLRPRLVQSLALSGESEPNEWRRWAPYTASYLPGYILRRPLKARHIPTGMDRLTNEAKFPASAAVYNIPALYRSAQALSSTLRMPLKVGRPPGIDLFHCTMPTLPIRMSDVPNVVTVHDLIPLVFPESTDINLLRHKRLMDCTIRHADVIFTVSNHTRDDLLRIFDIPEEKVQVTYQSVNIPDTIRCVDEDWLTWFLNRNFKLEKNGYFLFYGALEPKKNVRRLIDAYLLARTDSPLVVAGKKGWLHEAESTRLRRLSQPDANRRIHHIDYLPYEKLMLLLKGARALVFPSLYEGFGLPALEAMQLGVPVITSNTTSLPEICGDAAFLVDPEDSVAIADAIDHVDKDGTLAKELSRKGTERAEWFSPGRYMERLEAGYRSVL